MSTALSEVATFLQLNPNDVLTLLLRSHVTAVELSGAFDAVELTAFAHTQTTGAPWPTLREMIETGHRLVVFEDDLEAPRDAATLPDGAVEAGTASVTDASSSGGLSPAWLHRAPAWIRETSPSVGSDCMLTTGAGALIVLNHYDANATPAEEELIAAHDPMLVATRLERCRADYGHLPTLLVVDFAEIGDPNGGVQIANGLR